MKKGFKFTVGQNLKSEKKDITIIDREYREKYYKNKNSNIKFKWYKYKCNICGWDNAWIEESNLSKNKVCACCSGRKVIEGINDIRTTAPWMIDLGVSVKDAKTFTKKSNKKIEVKCPYCNKIKKITIYAIYKNRSIGCVCGDGSSYPEKIIISILDQLNINYITQLSRKTFKWCNDYRYDFYIPKYNLIIETNGLQHYRENSWKGNVLKKIQANDTTKEVLANMNGINNYVILDCKESNIEYIKNSVLNSELNNIFDLSIINWVKCENYAIYSNKVKEVCNYWNNKKEWETTKDLACIFNISRTTVIDYLKKGNKLMLCEYNPRSEMIKNCSENNKKHLIKEVEVFKKGISLGVFESVSELSRKSKELFGTELSIPGIVAVCNYKNKHHKGYTFRYTNEIDSLEKMLLNFKTPRKTTGKKVEVFKNNISLGIFESCFEVERQSEKMFGVKLLNTKVNAVARGQRNHHKGFTFKYVDDIRCIED